MTHKFCYDYPRPMMTVDAFLIAPDAEELSVLLIERKNEPYQGLWALPGGFVEMEEDLKVAAQRELFEETNIEMNHLIQLGTFGQPGRDPRGRTISTIFGFFCDEKLTAQASDDAQNADWFKLSQLPDLAFDHKQIIWHSLLQLVKEMIFYRGTAPNVFMLHSLLQRTHFPQNLENELKTNHKILDQIVGCLKSGLFSNKKI